MKELLPIFMARIVWGITWQTNMILAHCDNQAVVEVDTAKTHAAATKPTFSSLPLFTSH